jgi:DNA-directed RNA polymerase subunit RPC12/RpoP
METVKITCPDCKNNMEYWTKNNFIQCTKCKARIPVVPCIESVNENIDDEIEVIEVNV